MLGWPDTQTPLDTRRLSEFFAEPKNSHGASNVTGSSPTRWGLEQDFLSGTSSHLRRRWFTVGLQVAARGAPRSPALIRRFALG